VQALWAMAEKLDQLNLLQSIKALAVELKRTPTRVEFENTVKGGPGALKRFYTNNFSKLLEAAELPTYGSRRVDPGQEEILLRKYRQLCSKTEKIQGHVRHVLDLDEMFRRAGNPPVLKVSAQPDTHVKFMDIPAMNCYQKFLLWYQPDVHIIMGDFLDCEGISHWPSRDLNPRRLIPEIKEGRNLLKRTVENTKKCTTRIFLEGNHEHWIEMGLSQMPELFEGLEDLGLEINLKKLLNLSGFNYELFPMNQFIQIGKAHFTHGIYTGDNHTKKHLSVLKSTIYYGHLHDVQSRNETSMEGNVEAACLGCLCRLDAKFLKGKPNNWAHAHGVFEFFRDGTYNFYRPLITNGVSSFAGIVFDGNKE